MQTPVQIDFRGFVGAESQKLEINEHLSALERMFGGLIAGRVVVKAPEHHHRKGGPFEISIRLALPDGREVNVSHNPEADERYADFQFALGDAFRRAQRQLSDQVQRLHGEVKVSASQPIGQVVKLFEDHGFLETGAGLEVYFHKNSVLDGGFARLELGSKVSFVEERGDKGAQASTVKTLGKHSLK